MPTRAVALAVALAAAPARAGNNGLALTPPMSWRSWCVNRVLLARRARPPRPQFKPNDAAAHPHDP
jgi:hypothetical protein